MKTACALVRVTGSARLSDSECESLTSSSNMAKAPENSARQCRVSIVQGKGILVYCCLLSVCLSGEVQSIWKFSLNLCGGQFSVASVGKIFNLFSLSLSLSLFLSFWYTRVLTVLCTMLTVAVSVVGRWCKG